MTTDLHQNYEFQAVVYEPLVTQISPELQCSDTKRTTTWFLYFAAISSNLSQITVGLMLAWISPITKQLLSLDPDINPLGKPISILELSSIGTAQAIGSLIGPLIVGKYIDRLGRKRSVIALCIISTIAIVLLAYSTAIFMYLVTQLIIGICGSGLYVALPIYTSEITDDHNRGKISCLVGSGSALGTVISFISGPYLSIKVFTLTCAIPVALNTVLFLTILPESPVQLVNVKDIASAKIVLQRLRRKNPREIEADIKRIEYELTATLTPKNECGCLKILRDRSSRNGVIVATVAFNLLIISGQLPLTGYLELIFDKAESNIPSNICAFLTAIIQLVCYVGASFIVEPFGRRRLILFSTATPIIPLIFISVFFHLKDNGYDSVKSFSWFFVISFMLYTVLNNIGNATVPLALMNDFFTNDVKASAISFIIISSGICSALITFIVPIIIESVGVQWCFWIFTGTSVLATIFVYFLVPETKGKSLLEIQEILRNLM